MRKLITADMFAALRIVAELNLREELRAEVLRAQQRLSGRTDDAPRGDLEASVGVDAFLRIFELLVSKKAEKKIYEFLAGPFEMKPQEVEALGWGALLDQVTELLEGNDLKGFFTSLSGLITMKRST